MTIDILVDEHNFVVSNVAYNGWWGQLGSIAVAPFTIQRSGKVDFGSDQDTDQNDRFGIINLYGREIKEQEPIEYRDSTGAYMLRIASFKDLTQGLN